MRLADPDRSCMLRAVRPRSRNRDASASPPRERRALPRTSRAAIDRMLEPNERIVFSTGARAAIRRSHTKMSYVHVLVTDRDRILLVKVNPWWPFARPKLL